MTVTRRVAQPPAWWRQRYDAMVRHDAPNGANRRTKMVLIEASYHPAAVTRSMRRTLARWKRTA